MLHGRVSHRFMRSDGRLTKHPFSFQTAGTTKHSRGMNCPRLCCRLRPFLSKRARESRTPAGARDPWAKCTRMWISGSRTSDLPARWFERFIVRGKKEQLKVSIPPRIIASSFRLKKARLPAGTQRVFGFKVENPYAKTTVFHCRGRPRDFRLALRVRAIGATRERFTAPADLAQRCPRPPHPEPRFAGASRVAPFLAGMNV